MDSDTTPTVGPFTADEVPEIPLERPPLVKVVGQVRYPNVPELKTEDGIRPIREALRSRYPILREDKTLGVLITPEGATAQADQDTVWRLHDRGEVWQATIADTFFALETSAYTSHDDFCERFVELAEAIRVVADPVLYDRVGLRYIDHLSDESLLADLDRYVRPELFAGLAVSLPSDVKLSLSVCDSRFELEDMGMRARWGILPAGAQYDPGIPPAEGRSWVLDLDAYTSASGDYSAEEIGTVARRFAAKVYSFFRWSVSDDLLRHYGGKP